MGVLIRSVRDLILVCFTRSAETNFPKTGFKTNKLSPRDEVVTVVLMNVLYERQPGGVVHLHLLLMNRQNM